MVEVVLHLGSNVGDRELFLDQAIDIIKNDFGQILSQSSLYESEAWGKEDQQDFLNIAIVITTLLKPKDLLLKIKEVERYLGRVKKEHWGPRNIDIDILFYGQEVIDIPGLKIPHVELQNRNFVLIPLLEIIGDKIHPVLKLSVEEMYLNSIDQKEVWIYNENQ